MPEAQTAQVPLQAKDPFQLRVGFSRNVPESDVRSALASGDMGFLHSFTTGSTVDGPGCVLLHGHPAASFGAFIATTLIRGT